MHASFIQKNETSISFPRIYTLLRQVAVDRKRRLEPADLIQASGKAGIAQAFATAFYPVPVRAPPREGCSLAREQKRKGSIDDHWERRSNR
jgi:hypothetical protein